MGVNREVITHGTGEEKPVKGDTVTVEYTGMFESGEVYVQSIPCRPHTIQ